MIIRDIEEIGKLPVGTEFEYRVKARVERVPLDDKVNCDKCLFQLLECPACLRGMRDDGEEVRFIKI